MEVDEAFEAARLVAAQLRERWHKRVEMRPRN